MPVDMPTFHPLRDGQQARYCYFSGAWRPEGWFPFRSLLKVDLESHVVSNWDAGDGRLMPRLFLAKGKAWWLVTRWAIQHRVFFLDSLDVL